MTYKLVALDLDGTLLNEHGTVSDENFSVLHKLRDHGIKIVIATGRTYTAFKGFYSELGLVDPIISCNGAYIFDPKEERIIKGHPMPLDAVKKVIELFEQNDVFYQFYTPTTIYAKEEQYLVKKWRKNNENFSDENKVNIVVDSSIHKYVDEEDGSIFKVLGIEMDDELYRELINALGEIEGIEVVQSFHGAIDVMVEGVTKGLGLSDVCEYFGIELSETIAMGDHFNDEDMIKKAGLGVAMANGHIDIRAIADKIALPNTENGVAHFLKNMYNL